MDRRDKQSSLPSSLIPHLYAAPRDSSTRTTLASHSEDSDHDGSNISSLPLLSSFPPHIRPSSSYPSIVDVRQLPPVLPANPTYRSLESSFPHRSVSPTYSNQQTQIFPSRSSPTSMILLPSLASLSADIFPRNSSWREGEAGPSSLIHPRQRYYDSPRQRVASQPERVIFPPINTSGYGSTYRELHRQHTRYHPYFSRQSFLDTPISPLPPLQHLGSMELPPLLDRRDAFSYPQVGSLTISDSSPSNYLGQVSTPEFEPSYGSEPLSVNIGSGKGSDGRRNKKRRAQSMDIDDVPKKFPKPNKPKPRPRKTAVACNFCRGRKLGCDGKKPCKNCSTRQFECEYVSTQRRRGPGKAPKGSRSRKGRRENARSSSKKIGDRLPTMVPSPDLRPYISVLSLNSFEPPDGTPQYPSEGPERPMRQQGSRSRTSRSRETSSAEDHSDVKDIQRNPSGS